MAVAGPWHPMATTITTKLMVARTHRDEESFGSLGPGRNREGLMSAQQDLLNEFGQVLDRFNQSPAMRRFLDGQIGIAHYKWMLRQIFHQVRENPQIQALATVSFRGAQRHVIRKFYIHATSEIGHDQLALNDLAGGHVRQLRRDVKEYDLGDRRVYVIADGRLVNLAAAEGHPAAVMDMSFANQALAAEYGAKHHKELSPAVHVMPDEIDREVARLKLEALDVKIDTMTPEQERYVKSWQEGT